MANGLYKKILVPLDGSKCSERALVEAITLAKQCDAKIVGLYIVPFS
ncbi:MAG: universal stress protein, partial [Candidatus Nitrosomaritimum yanchengensis]